MSLVEICHMSRLLVVPSPTLESHRSPLLSYQACYHQTILTTMSFVIPLCDSARADWRSEFAKLDVTLTACDLVVGVCVSRCEMPDRSQVDSG